MTKPTVKTISISGPFDVRHVGGVSVGGATTSIGGIERMSTSIEPDETPSHTFVAQGNIEVPRRSNSLVRTLSRPSLRLKTSISRMRGHSMTNSPDTYIRGTKFEEVNKAPEASEQSDIPTQGLRKKPSISRFWQKAYHESPVTLSDQDASPLRNNETTTPDKDHAAPKTKPSLSRLLSGPSSDKRQAALKSHPPAPQSRPFPPPRAPLQKVQPTVRLKRADSGTAIDFDNVPVEERPLGFKDIMAVSSFADRMVLYKKSREYWAHADHGLDEWVERAGTRRQLLV